MYAFFTSLGLPECLIGIGAICTLVGTLLIGVKQGNDQIHVRDQIIQEQRNLMTGGDGYFFLRPSLLPESNEFILVGEFRGKYPLYDVTIEVQEYNGVAHGHNFQYDLGPQYSVQIGTIHPLKSASVFKQLVLPISGVANFGKRYFLKISSRNGVIEQDIYVRGTQHGFVQAFKVVQLLPRYGGRPGSILDRIEARIKKVDSSFPVHELGISTGNSGWNQDFQEQ